MSSMKLYELTNKFDELNELYDSLVDNETGEIVDVDMFEKAEELEKFLLSELESKSENIVKFIRNKESDLATIKNEIDRLNDLKKKEEKKLESFKEYLKSNMNRLNATKIETPLGNISIRKSQKVVVNENIIPKDKRWYRVETVEKFDKNVIKKLIKGGEDIEGTLIEDTFSINIK